MNNGCQVLAYPAMITRHPLFAFRIEVIDSSQSSGNRHIRDSRSVSCHLNCIISHLEIVVS